MIRSVAQRTLPLLILAACSLANGQYFKTHGVSLAAGATTSFDRTLTSSASSGTYAIPTSGGGTVDTTVSNQQVFTTNSVGFLGSLQFHPKPWAGVELNYGYNRYSERYAFDYTAAAAQTSSGATAQSLSITPNVHEFTGAYQFHPKHIPFQPFVNVGGGAIDFDPRSGVANQFRGAGLLETGFDVPAGKSSHIGFRIEGRSLFYRTPNFYQPAISTRSWQATIQPDVSTYYRF